MSKTRASTRPTPPWQGLVGEGGATTRLVAVAGADAGRVYQVAADALVGRSSSAAVALSDGDVSRRHAFVHVDEDGAVWVEDLDSRNGTFVNGRRVNKHRIAVGDLVRFGADAELRLSEHNPIQAQLIERQRYECIGRLARGVAHDFNNMLGAVAAGLDFIDGEVGVDRASDEIEASLQDMRQAVQRASELARRLLLSTKRGAAGHGPQDLTAICEQAVELAARTLGRHIEVVSEIERRLVVRGDAAALHQVLINLFVNARDAMPGGGRVTLSTGRAPAAGAGGAGQVRLVVRDDGGGMDEETQRRAFEPFFTTRAPGAGFGLGLTTVKEIVVAQGGQVSLDSTPGEGTRVQILLPLEPARAHRRLITAGPRQMLPPPAGTRVLLADDEPMVRRSLGRLLRRADFLVLDAANGREAVDGYEAADPKPDVVLLDVDMPELDGVAACAELLQRHPQARIVMLSGSQDPDREAALRQLGALDVLHKPVSSVELLMCLGQVQRLSRDEVEMEDTQRIRRRDTDEHR